MGTLIIMSVFAFFMEAFLLIILLVVKKDIKDIQMAVNYIYNNQNKMNYIYKVVKENQVVKEVRKEKEREKKTTPLRKGKTP